MSRKKTKAQKKLTQLRVKETVTKVVTQAKPQPSFDNLANSFIIKDLKRTLLYTLFIIAVLLGIFVYTKTS